MATALSHPRTKSAVFYPESDGKPMGETLIHQHAMIELIVGLRDWFADDPRVLVAGDLFLYFVEGDPTRVVCPDLMVVRGVDRDRDWNTYKTWEVGGKGPNLVVEVSSKSTRRDDLRNKFLVYRDDLKVREYVVFDPLGEYLKPPLQGYRLEGEDYFAIDVEEGRLPIEALGLDLVAVGRTVRLFDPRVGRIIPNRLEALQAQQAANRTQEDAIRAQEDAIRAQENAIRAQENAIRERDAMIREREEMIAQQSRANDQRELDLARVERERDQLLAEIARLRSGDRSD